MPVDKNQLSQTLQEMKHQYENAIIEGTYTSLIRSKKLIGLLHSFVFSVLENLVDSSWIITDKKVYGFPKKKEQDILVQPPQDAKGTVSVGPILAVNIRSQLSSIEKNYDTLFERVFAEALNLHNRFPYIVLGYLYLLPKRGYDQNATRKKQVLLSEKYDLEKYILSFLSIANRKFATDPPWKYEKVCLLLVDFEKEPPRIIDSMDEIVAEGLVRPEFAKLYGFDDLGIDTFFDDLYKTMMERYYLLVK